MGIIVSEEYTNKNGFVIPNYYVNIDNITILKSNLDAFKYTIEADKRVYVSQQARNENRNPVETTKVILSSDTVDDIHGQVYTEIKKGFQNYTDDL